MKKSFSVCIVILMLLFSGCESHKVIAPTEKTAAKLDFSGNNFDTAEIKAQDEVYYYLRDKELFSEQYKNVTVQTGYIDVKDSSGEMFQTCLIDNEYNCFHVRGSKGVSNGEIGIYNLNTKKYTKLLELPLESQAGLNTVDDNYLIWTESMDDSNWYKTRLHIYDRKQKKDEVIYCHSTDPETGMVYAWNWSKPVIIKDKIYFDDYTGPSKVDMFCYDIKSKEIKKIQEMAKWPTKYNGDVAWNEKGEENQIFIRTFDGKQKSLITTIDTDEGMFGLNTGGDTLVIINNGLYVDKHDGNGLQVYRDEKVLPIIATKKSSSYLEWPETDGRVVVFGTCDIYHKPVFYDIKYDKIIELDSAETGFLYGKYLSDKFLMFTRRVNQKDENTGSFYYLIRLEDLK